MKEVDLHLSYLVLGHGMYIKQIIYHHYTMNTDLIALELHESECAHLAIKYYKSHESLYICYKFIVLSCLQHLSLYYTV